MPNTPFKKRVLSLAILHIALLGSMTTAAAPNPDEVLSLSELNSSIVDFDQVSDYAKKSVVRLELLGVLKQAQTLQPKKPADKIFLRQLLGTLRFYGKGALTYGDAKKIIAKQFIKKDKHIANTVSFEGLLTKKGYRDYDIISREDLAYLVAHARQLDIVETGDPIHNPAIATPGPLLGPTVYQSGVDDTGATFDGSTISLFHRGLNKLNTTFAQDPELTLQLHPEVFKSVSVGGISVESLQDLTAQLEVELADGTIHRTPLTSLVPFSIHGADGKAGDIRIEDGLLVLADDLKGELNTFELNGHTFDAQETALEILDQAYYNGDATSPEVVAVVVDDLQTRGFTLRDRRIVMHNLILAKTALQQKGLTPLSAPFNTIAGPSSASRSFDEGLLYQLYDLATHWLTLANSAQTEALHSDLKDSDNQAILLDGTKILTASTLLPHITDLANAPFLPNEALSSRVKKSGALLPSEPIAFQLDRLKRAAYILLDDALSTGQADHLVTHGEIIRDNTVNSDAFSLSAGEFSAIRIPTLQSPLIDALNDFTQAYEKLVALISGVYVTSPLNTLDESQWQTINRKFAASILSEDMGQVRIGDLEFQLDMLATPSHVRSNIAPENDLTAFRQSEGFSLDNAREAFPIRLSEYICNGLVVDQNGEVIGSAKINPLQQQDLISDIDTDAANCQEATQSPRYQQLLFVDNLQLPPFGPAATFISTQGIEIINRLLLKPADKSLDIADIRLSYRLNEAEVNQAPEANIKGPERVKPRRFFRLDGRQSIDVDNDSLRYRWKIKRGKAKIFQSPKSGLAYLYPLSPGKLTVQLEVNDGTANSTAVNKTIEVKKFNRFKKDTTSF